MERRKNYAVILKELGCFIECAKFEQAYRKPPIFRVSISGLCGFRGAYKKKFLKKLKKRIYRNKGYFRLLHMMLDLCRKTEGNPFSTKI